MESLALMSVHTHSLIAMPVSESHSIWRVKPLVSVEVATSDTAVTESLQASSREWRPGGELRHSIHPLCLDVVLLSSLPLVDTSPVWDTSEQTCAMVAIHMWIRICLNDFG